MTPTEGERFSQHITTVKPLKFPSVSRPPGSLPFVASHIFLYHGMLEIYQIQALICAVVCINLRNQNHCHSDRKHVSYQVSSEHFANHQNDINVSKFQILMFK